MVQAALLEQFGILVSIGYLNRIRANWSGGNRTVHRGKKLQVLVQQQKPTGKKGLAAASS